MSSSEVRICPQCGSAGVDFSTIVQGRGECRGCKWTGTREELVVIPFSHAFMTDESVMMQFTQDLRQLLARDVGVVLLGYLTKWGFVKTISVAGKTQVDSRQFTRYLVAIAKAILVAVLEERARQEMPPQEIATHGAEDGRPS